MVILFTLTGLLQYNQRNNPFMDVGQIHNDGLDDIVTHLTGDFFIPVIAADYIVANYTTYVPYAKQSVLPMAVLGSNMAVDAKNSIEGLDLNGGDNMYVQKALSLIECFPPSVSANTVEKSYAIFGDNNSETMDLYQQQFLTKTNDLLNSILDSGLPAEQQILPLVAHSVLMGSYRYWQKVYFNDGGSNAWYAYITNIIADIKDINWRQVIMQDIKGALAGAVAGGLNNPDNLNGGITIGAAVAGMAASAQDIVYQTGFTEVFDPKP